MSGIFSVLNLSRDALFVQQVGISVTGNNIANVNTPNYARQKVIMEPSTATSSLGGKGLIGTGVKLENIVQVRDAYLDNQILLQKQSYGKYATKNDILKQLEILFDNTASSGLSDAINNFFNTFSDLANNPQGYPERVSVKEMGISLALSFSQIDTNIRQVRSDANGKINVTVLKINEITEEIAQLNNFIYKAELGTEKANDYRDRRAALLDELAEMIDISFLENENNQAFVYTSTGRSLVRAGESFDLRVAADSDNNDFYDVQLGIGNGNYIDITSEISSGSMASYLEMRDIFIPETIEKLDQLAAAIINEVNILHTQGYGLDESTGINFFDPLSASVQDDPDNTGSGTVSYVSMDQTAINRDSFEIRFTDATTFTVYNTTDGEAVSTGNSYTDGADITFEGITVSISGSVASGDVFSVKAAANAARDISINDTIITNVNKIAAAQDVSSLPGDNTNALAIASLKNSLVLTNDTSTFDDYLTSIIVSEIGIEVSNAAFNEEQQETMVMQLENRREQISGVSLDEEAINLMKFQSAYESIANVIATVDEMLDSLISSIR